MFYRRKLTSHQNMDSELKFHRSCGEDWWVIWIRRGCPTIPTLQVEKTKTMHIHQIKYSQGVFISQKWSFWSISINTIVQYSCIEVFARAFDWTVHSLLSFFFTVDWTEQRNTEYYMVFVTLTKRKHLLEASVFTLVMALFNLRKRIPP